MKNLEVSGILKKGDRVKPEQKKCGLIGGCGEECCDENIFSEACREKVRGGQCPSFRTEQELDTLPLQRAEQKTRPYEDIAKECGLRKQKTEK